MKALRRYDFAGWDTRVEMHYDRFGNWCRADDVEELEKLFGNTAQHMMSMYYALCDILVPDPEVDPEDVMDRAKRVIERFHNDELQTVMVELPDDDEDDNADDESPTTNGEQP